MPQAIGAVKGILMRTALIAAIAASAIVPSGAEAQSAKYFMRSKLTGTASARVVQAPVRSGLTCDGAIRPYTMPYPYVKGEGPLAMASPTLETARKACEDFGASRGAAARDYNICFIVVNQNGPDPTGYNVYIYQGQVYEFDRSNPYYAGHMTAACSWAP